MTSLMEQPLTPLLIAGIFTICFYALTLATSLISLRMGAAQRGQFNVYALFAVMTHCFFLYLVIDREDSQNLTLFNMMGLTNWLAMIILLANSFHRDTRLMVAIISSFALLSSIFGLTSEGQSLANLSGQWASLLHIFSAITATGFLLLAAVQAVLLAYADHRLRSHPMQMPGFMPPLQSLESFLFQLLLAGFCLMSGALIIAIFFLQDSFTNQPLHKSILSTLAWLTYGVLIVGHIWKGWRGKTAAKWTLIGFALLSLGYFGSKLVIELILNK